MERTNTASPQRMDLLGHDRQETKDQAGPPAATK